MTKKGSADYELGIPMLTAARLEPGTSRTQILCVTAMLTCFMLCIAQFSLVSPTNYTSRFHTCTLEAPNTASVTLTKE